MVRLRRCWIAAMALSACSVGDGKENASSFGMTFPNPGSASASSATTASDTDVEDDSTSDEDDSNDEVSTTEEEPPPDTSGTTDPVTSGDPVTTGNDTGMVTGGEQPDTGMYSPCLMVTECVGNNVCMTVDDNGDMSGFCSDAACADPAADCDGTPGGTAMPVCIAVDLDGMPDMICALSCAGGLTCPTPMQCRVGLPVGDICS